MNWEPAGHLQASLGPSGPETPKKSEKPPAPGPPESLEKVSKKSGESGKSLNKVPKDFFETFFRLFGVSGLDGPRDPCEWPTGSQLLKDKFAFFEAIFSSKSPITERREAACTMPTLARESRACFKHPFNWTGSVP